MHLAASVRIEGRKYALSCPVFRNCAQVSLCVAWISFPEPRYCSRLCYFFILLEKSNLERTLQRMAVVSLPEMQSTWVNSIDSSLHNPHIFACKDGYWLSFACYVKATIMEQDSRQDSRTRKVAFGNVFAFGSELTPLSPSPTQLCRHAGWHFNP